MAQVASSRDSRGNTAATALSHSLDVCGNPFSSQLHMCLHTGDDSGHTRFRFRFVGEGVWLHSCAFQRESARKIARDRAANKGTGNSRKEVEEQSVDVCDCIGVD
jgi:hypothetical protein